MTLSFFVIKFEYFKNIKSSYLKMLKMTFKNIPFWKLAGHGKFFEAKWDQLITFPIKHTWGQQQKNLWMYKPLTVPSADFVSILKLPSAASYP